MLINMIGLRSPTPELKRVQDLSTTNYCDPEILLSWLHNVTLLSIWMGSIEFLSCF